MLKLRICGKPDLNMATLQMSLAWWLQAVRAALELGQEAGDCAAKTELAEHCLALVKAGSLHFPGVSAPGQRGLRIFIETLPRSVRAPPCCVVKLTSNHPLSPCQPTLAQVIAVECLLRVMHSSV